jgi:hypothetical protein
MLSDEAIVLKGGPFSTRYMALYLIAFTSYDLFFVARKERLLSKEFSFFLFLKVFIGDSLSSSPRDI